MSKELDSLLKKKEIETKKLGIATKEQFEELHKKVFLKKELVRCKDI